MKLKKLIENLPVKVHGNKEIEVTGLCSHSKRVAPGNLFIIKKGHTDDGSKYIQEAISSGAQAILTSFFDPFLKETTQIVSENLLEMEIELGNRFYAYPSQDLFTVAVTGTSGKTTTSYLIKHLFEEFHISTGLIGTIEYITGTFHFSSELTTPDVITNQKLLREMVKNGCESAILEVSSHGLAQNRVSGIDFDAAIFTNLSHDHLDYHKTMENYAKEKAKLFTLLKAEAVAIVNRDSPWTEQMIKNCKAEVLTFGFSEKADLYAKDIQLNERGTSFTMVFRGESISCHWNLIGRFNILNCLAASLTCLAKGIDFKKLSSVIAKYLSTPGRLDRVENRAGLNIFIDYAHKPDALEKALLCLQEIKKGKIITVFGCGGDRDKSKRPLMGTIAENLSDFTIITSDNPRTENPHTIIEEIKQGFSHPEKFCIEVDRKEAIFQALKMAKKQDLILIAGKGHEKYQIFSHQTVPFDDKKIAREFANNQT